MAVQEGAGMTRMAEDKDIPLKRKHHLFLNTLQRCHRGRHREFQVIHKRLKFLCIHRVKPAVRIVGRTLGQFSLPAQGSDGFLKLETVSRTAAVRGKHLLKVAEGA